MPYSMALYFSRVQEILTHEMNKELLGNATIVIPAHILKIIAHRNGFLFFLL